MNVKDISTSSTFFCLCPLNLSFKLNFNRSKVANCQLASATWFGDLNLMRILLNFADSLNFKRVGQGTVTVFTEFSVVTQ